MIARSMSGRGWSRHLWLFAPALAAAPALALEDAKWRAFYVVAVFIAFPVALVVRHPKLWLFALCALSAFNFTKIVAGNPDAPALDPAVAVSAADIPLVVLLAIAWVDRASRGATGSRARWSARTALLIGAAFVACAVAGALSAENPRGVLIGALAPARMVLALAVAAAWATAPESRRWATTGLFLALAAQSAIAVAQYAAGSSFGLYTHSEEVTRTAILTRSGGTLNPTVLSEYIGVVAPLALAGAFAARRRTVAAALVGLFAVAATASVMTLSRGGLMNLAISTAIIGGGAIWTRGLPRLRTVVLISGLLALALLLGIVFADAVSARINKLALEAEEEGARLAQAKQALAMILDNPITGVGFGNYVARMGDYGQTLPYPVHNKLLLVTAETGIPGGALYVVLWLFTLGVTVRQIVASRGAERMFHVGVAASLMGTLLNMNSDIYGAGGAPELALFLVSGLTLGARGNEIERRSAWELLGLPCKRYARAR